jgi:hypothetical protein
MGIKPPAASACSMRWQFIPVTVAILPSLDRTLRLAGPYAAITAPSAVRRHSNSHRQLNSPTGDPAGFPNALWRDGLPDRCCQGAHPSLVVYSNSIVIEAVSDGVAADVSHVVKGITQTGVAYGNASSDSSEFSVIQFYGLEFDELLHWFPFLHGRQLWSEDSSKRKIENGTPLARQPCRDPN